MSVAVTNRTIRKPSPSELASISYRSHPRYRKMHAHWMIAEHPSNIIRDYSGHGRHLTYTGRTGGTPSTTPGQNVVVARGGRVVQFDGANDIYTRTITDPLDFQNFTVSAWIFPDSIVANMSHFDLMDVSGNKFQLDFYMNGSSNYILWMTGDDRLNLGTLATGVWQHCVITRLNGDELSGYINAEVRDAQTVSTAIDSADTYFLGSQHDNQAEQVWPGLLDDIRLYNRGMRFEEVRSLYHHPYLEFRPKTNVGFVAAAIGRIMGSLARYGGLAGQGGLAGAGGGLAG